MRDGKDNTRRKRQAKRIKKMPAKEMGFMEQKRFLDQKAKEKCSIKK